jgi:hypothetical protein
MPPPATPRTKNAARCCSQWRIQPALPAELTATLELAADFAKASKAKATQDAYGSDFRIFESWCCPRGLKALPATAESLCAFLADNQDYRRDRAPQPRDVENVFKRCRGIRGSRRRGTAVGGDMTHEIRWRSKFCAS